MATVVTTKPSGLWSTCFHPENSSDVSWSSPVIIGWHESGACDGFVRFQLNIPSGTTVSSATVTLWVLSRIAVDSVNVSLSFAAVDNAPEPMKSLVGGMAFTTAVAWNGLPAPAHNESFVSPDLATSLQEVIDRPGWVAGNYVLLRIKENGSTQAGAWRNFYGWYDEGAYEPYWPTLNVAYEGGSAQKTNAYQSPGKFDLAIHVNNDPELYFPETTYLGKQPSDNYSEGYISYTTLIRIPLYLPKGMQIDDARLRLMSIYAGAEATVNISICFVDTDHYPPFPIRYDRMRWRTNVTAADVAAAPKTAVVAWNDLPMTPAFQELSTPNLAGLLQGIVNRDGWKTGNAVLAVLSDNGSTPGAWRAFRPTFEVYGSGPGPSRFVVSFTPENDDTFAAGSVTALLPSCGGWCGDVYPSAGLTPSRVIALWSKDAWQTVDDSVVQYALEGVDWDIDSVFNDATAWQILVHVCGHLAYATESGDVWRCAAKTLELGYGDCEDGAILLAAMLRGLGCPKDAVKVIFGNYGIDSSGHAWVVYRRFSDQQWIVLDWTDNVRSGGLSAYPTVFDLKSSYHTIDYVLTWDSFTTNPTDIWRQFETLRAVGSCTAPLAVVTAQAGLSAVGACAAPAADVVAHCGAVGACVAPAAVVAAVGTRHVSAVGACVAPLAGVVAHAGGRAACLAPIPAVEAYAGAVAAVTALVPAVAARGTARPLVVGLMAAPCGVVAGHALIGAVAWGDCLAPAAVVRATVLDGVTAYGEMTAPMAIVRASSGARLFGWAEITAPRPTVRGHAVSRPAWAGDVLRFNPGRLA